MKARGVRVYTIGIGSEAGAPIPEIGGGFAKDQNGNVVLSRPDERALQALASETGGMFVRSVAGDLDLQRVYNDGIAAKVAKKDFTATQRKQWYERFQWFIAAAVLLLLIEACLRDVRFATLVLAALWLAVPSSEGLAADVKAAHDDYAAGDYAAAAQKFQAAEAQDPEDAVATYNRAVSQYKQQQWQEAAAGFAKSAQAADQRLATDSYYNLGNALTSAGKYDDAIKAFENALALSPKDQDARDNLAQVKKLQAQKKQQDEQKKSDDSQKQDDANKGQDPQDAPKPGQEGDKKDQPPAGQQPQPGESSDQKGQPQPSDQSQANSQQDGKEGAPEPGKDQQASSKPGEPSPDKPDAGKDGQQADQASAGKDGSEQEPAQPTAPSPDAPPKAGEQKKPATAEEGQTPPPATADAGDKPAGTNAGSGTDSAAAAAKPGDAQPTSPGTISRAEAEQVLRTVTDQAQKYLNSAPQQGRAKPRRSDKDW